MLANKLTDIWDFVHSRICYQLFITPLPIPLDKKYRDFAERACEFIANNRSKIITIPSPRHHVIHHFAQENNPQAKKILIAHGWNSRAAYMVRIIRCLHQQGFDVYALDFPAHGEANGLQLTWLESVMILKETINKLGPLYAVIGHSFGGSMLLNTLNLAGQLPEWQLDSPPEKAILIASPTNMRTPVSKFARRFKLSSQGFLLLRDVIRQNSSMNINHLNFRHFIKHGKIPILCIHGEEDKSISPQESIVFCRHYPHASLALIPEIDHVGVLIDERVEKIACNFLQRQGPNHDASELEK